MERIRAPFIIMETWKSIVEFLKEIGAIIGVAVTIFGIITGLVKPIRKKFIAWIRKTVSADEQSKQIEDVHAEIVELSKTVTDWVAQQKLHNDSVDKRFDEIADQNAQLKEADFYTLGNVIREVYHENKAEKRLSERDYELCGKVYKLYHDEWQQNGPIEAMWSEMKSWEKIFD